MTEAKVLSSVPSLLPLYAKAATGGKSSNRTSTLKTPALAVNGVTVSPSRDEEFRRIVGAPPVDHVAGAAFFGHVHSLIMPLQMELMAADDFPLPMMGLIHTSNTYRQLAPVPVGSKVDVEVRVAGFRAHRSGTEIVHEATVSQDGTVLVEETSVYLAKGKSLDDVNADPDSDSSSASAARRPAFAVPVPTAQWRIPGSIGRTWAKVSGDWNPIHVTGLTAKALGMPGVVAHGMYTASRALAESDVPGGTPFEFHIDFAAPVIVPATVMVAITRAGEVVDGVARGGTDIVAWNRKKRRPHFTGHVRDV